MEKLKEKKFALALGALAVVIYLGCFLFMALLGTDNLIRLSNLLFHGVDFSNIIRLDIPITETIIGLVVSFFIWAFLGYLFVLIYNRLK